MADSTDAPRQALHAVYDALVAAADFYALRNMHKSGLDYPDATTMYRAYEPELYRFDQLYRHFCEAADTAEEQGWNIVKPLRADIEAHYVNWYLTNLALAWGKFIEPEDGLLSNWQIDKVPNQHRFYDRNVRPWLEEADSRRAFVIISDAFRYEAAQELTSELNGKYRFEARLSSQLGVLPSYTALGMASLSEGHVVGLCGNWAAVTLQIPEWHRVLSFIGPSLIGTDKANFLATIKQYVPAEEHVMVGNDHSLRAYASPDDRRAADAAGWRFLSEGAFAAGGR